MKKEKQKTAPKVSHPKKEIRPDKKFPSLFYGLALSLFAFLLYSQTIRYEYVLDDNMVMKLNTSVQKGLGGISELFTHSTVYGFNGLNHGAYRPLTMISFAIEKHFSGNNPAAGHFANVLLYAVCAFVLFNCLVRLFRNMNPWLAAAATALFIAHPVHTEVAANIKSRDEMLSFIFGILALHSFLKWHDLKQKRFLFAGIIIFFPAMLSKENAITFAAIIPLALYFFRNISIKEISLSFLSVGATAALYLLMRNSFLDPVPPQEKIIIIDNVIAGAANLNEKFATIMHIAGLYISLLVFPHPLSWDYSFNQVPLVTFSNLKTIVFSIVITGLMIFSLLTLKKKNIFSFCILFFFVTLSVVSNLFVEIAATMAERFLFTPSLAWCIALPALIASLKRIPLSEVSWKKSGFIFYVLIPVIILGSIKTISYSRVWKNNFDLFTYGVQASPASARTHTSLAFEYSVKAGQAHEAQEKKKYFEASIREFETALNIFPRYGDSWYNLGHTYDLLARYDEAAAAYRNAIKFKPLMAMPYNNLGAIYIRKDSIAAAIPLLEKAISLDKNYKDAYANLGAAYHTVGNFREAITQYEKALAIDPNFENPRNNLEKAKRSLEGLN